MLGGKGSKELSLCSRWLCYLRIDSLDKITERVFFQGWRRMLFDQCNSKTLSHVYVYVCVYVCTHAVKMSGIRNTEECQIGKTGSWGSILISCFFSDLVEVETIMGVHGLANLETSRALKHLGPGWWSVGSVKVSSSPVLQFLSPITSCNSQA